MAMTKVTNEYLESGIDASKLTGTLPAISGANLINLPVSGGGKVVQVVNFQTGATASTTTTSPLDDTIPQNSEGGEFMTLSITPTSATNKLKIDVMYMSSTGTTNAWVTAALFQDSIASALASSVIFQPSATGGFSQGFTHYMTSGTTSPTTFKVRAGQSSAGTFVFNGGGAGRFHGGVIASSITITEIE